MAELVVGKKYKITEFHPDDSYYRMTHFLGEEAVFLGKSDGCYGFRFKDRTRSFLSGFTYEECCGEGSCELPPKEAEFATMEFEEKDLEQQTIDFKTIPLASNIVITTEGSSFLPKGISTTPELEYLSGITRPSIDELSGTTRPTPTFNLIEIVSNSLKDLLQYKNKRYGDTALQPIGVFSKSSAETGLLQRIDDKISRIKTSPEIRKNDVCDLMGYLTLLCISKDWYNFDEFKD